MVNTRIIGLFVRYFFLLVLGLNLSLLYDVLLYVTVVVSSFVFSLFSSPLVVDHFIRLPFVVLEIIPSCVAGSAFYLLFVLVFSLGDVSFGKRCRILVFSVGLLFVFNILRIVVLAFLGSSSFFSVLHWLLFNVLSTLVVVCLWLLSVRLFSVSSVPFFTDIRFLLGKDLQYSKRGKRYKNAAQKYSKHDGRDAFSSVKSQKPRKRRSRPRPRSR